MLRSLFIIFFFQLIGEAIQKFFEINIPGPVIGLALLLLTFIFLRKPSSPYQKIKKEISETSHKIINYLSLILIGTLATLVFTAFIMEKIINLEKKNVKRR